MNDRAIAELETADLDDPEVLWRLARSRIDKAENIEGKNALKIYEQALQEAEKAVKLDPKNPSVLQTLSIVYGRIALFKGVFKSIDLVNKVHNTALLAVAESDSMPVALYVLGRTHKKLIEKSGLVRSLLGLGWASPDSVTYYFEYALAVSGGNMIQCRVEYGDFLLNTVKNKQAAAEMLRTALELPLRDEQDAKAKDWANELLRKIK